MKKPVSVLLLSWVLLFVFISKTAFSMAIIDAGYLDADDDVYNDDGGSELHHRSRRSTNTSSSGNLMVFITPLLDLSYYFNPNDEITFEIRAAYNGSGPLITNIDIGITSEWLVMPNVVDKMGFTGAVSDGTKVTFTLDSLDVNAEIVANLTTTVKPTITPLGSVKLDFTVNATQNAGSISIANGASSPILYGVFPDINMTKSTDNAIPVYSSFTMQMRIVLPIMHTSLLLELTTNVEEYVFMELQSVSVESKGSKIDSSKNGEITYDSSPENIEKDRVEIKFGDVSINTAGGEPTEAERTIVISFTVKVNDHENVANGSTHYVGAGLQAGPSVLWVEQYTVEIIKVNQPALNFTVECEQATNVTRLYINDIVKFDFEIAHATTSDTNADSVSLTICSDGSLTPEPALAMTNSNSTCALYAPFSGNVVNLGDTETFSVLMKVSSKITPLMDIAPETILTYKKGTLTKRPIKKVVKDVTTGTPLFRFDLNGSSDVITPGTMVDFYLTIVLPMMSSPLVVEVVMPTVNNESVMSLKSLTFESVGSNINLDTTLINTTRVSAGVLDLGTATNNASSDIDSPDNEIRVKFQAILNDNRNISNASSYWVGAGVLGKPKMVWIGQIKINTYFPEDSKPLLDIDLSMVGQGDTYEYAVNFTQMKNSVQYAANVTFEYYLPPYVEFVEETTSSSNIQSVSGTRFKYLPEYLYFAEAFNHSIRVTLNRSKSPYPGTFDFSVMVRVSYGSMHTSQKYEFFKAVKRSITVLPDYPKIPRNPRAKDHYYGRGFYWNKADGKFYVCLNQHVPTMTPACYQHLYDTKYSAVDRRIGCILGMDSGVMYGLARNGITPMKNENGDWFVIQDKELPAKNVFTFKDLSGTTSVGVVPSPNPIHIDDDSGNQWQGTGDGLYFKGSSDTDWKMRAKWYISS